MRGIIRRIASTAVVGSLLTAGVPAQETAEKARYHYEPEHIRRVLSTWVVPCSPGSAGFSSDNINACLQGALRLDNPEPLQTGGWLRSPAMPDYLLTWISHPTVNAGQPTWYAIGPVARQSPRCYELGTEPNRLLQLPAVLANIDDGLLMLQAALLVIRQQTDPAQELGLLTSVSELIEAAPTLEEQKWIARSDHWEAYGLNAGYWYPDYTGELEPVPGADTLKLLTEPPRFVEYPDSQVIRVPVIGYFMAGSDGEPEVRLVEYSVTFQGGRNSAVAADTVRAWPLGWRRSADGERVYYGGLKAWIDSVRVAEN